MSSAHLALDFFTRCIPADVLLRQEQNEDEDEEEEDDKKNDDGTQDEGYSE
jgi:hypothetical protein